MKFLSVLKPENFCAIASSVSSLNDIILSEYKNNPFYLKICKYLDNKSLPILIYKFVTLVLVTVFTYLTPKFMFLPIAAFPFLNFATILPLLVTLVSRKLATLL